MPLSKEVNLNNVVTRRTLLSMGALGALGEVVSGCSSRECTRAIEISNSQYGAEQGVAGFEAVDASDRTITRVPLYIDKAGTLESKSREEVFLGIGLPVGPYEGYYIDRNGRRISSKQSIPVPCGQLREDVYPINNRLGGTYPGSRGIDWGWFNDLRCLALGAGAAAIGLGLLAISRRRSTIARTTTRTTTGGSTRP